MRMAPPLARFQVMQGNAQGPRDGGDGSYDAIREGYDMRKHGGVSGEKLTHGALSEDFVRNFAVVGTPGRCLDQLLALRALGIDRFVIVGPGFYPAEWGGEAGRFAREVIPALRRA
jgi:alkanesulfonate monooxygenase SsuD/methylene tetrahydromethanopterin reductase-like flavin-dependent oxidoreductase (luciferase family)